MKRLLLGCALLALCASSAFAGGVNISWGDACWSDPAHANLQQFACNTNTGCALMTCSFSPHYDQPEWVGVEVHLDGQSDDSALPYWWLMAPGECRASALTVSNDFASAPKIGCTDPWTGRVTAGGLVYYQDGTSAGGWNLAKMMVVYLVDVETPVSLSAGTEYYACQVRISYVHTAGRNIVSGCDRPMAWTLALVRSCPVYGCDDLTEPLPGGNQCLNWQNSELPWCRAYVVPARNQTWGEIKSLYR